MLERILARGGIVVFFIMALEIAIMISPFAFFFYSVFNPIFSWIDAIPSTRWLTHFFLPHMILPPTLFLKAVRILGSVLFITGALAFVVCVLQVYLGKVFGWGIASKGLYSIIRHPQYLALSLWGIGMSILWPRFIVLVTLSLMLVLYYYLANDEEKRMTRRYGQAYVGYMDRTGMFLPLTIEKPIGSFFGSTRFGRLGKPLVFLMVPVLVIGAGFIFRILTLNSLPMAANSNITVVSIMPEDGALDETVINTIKKNNVEFLLRDENYLGYVMPVDYIMQGMIANTGTEHHLWKQNQTINLIADWVLHPFEHLRRPPSDMMAKMHNVDPKVARRHHCSLGIDQKSLDCASCPYRRVIFVEIMPGSKNPDMGKKAFAFNSIRVPVGFVDLDTKTGQIISAQRVESTTAWKNVPTPEI